MLPFSGLKHLAPCHPRALPWELDNAPRHLVKLGLLLPLRKDKVHAGLEAQSYSSVKTLSGQKADLFTLVNFTLFGQRLFRRIELYASVYNLFDQRYGHPGAAQHLQDIILQDGRTVRVKLVYAFKP